MFSQSVFEDWINIDVAGEINKKFELKIEYQHKYNHEDNRIRSSHVDMGVTYKINKFSIGGFYREIYEMKGDNRVTELRPHLDLSYKINDNLSFILCDFVTLNTISLFSMLNTKGVKDLG